ncbi:MAG: hypothetical protein ABSA05_07255, partial [Opitutaceae bacterium]
MNHLKRYLGPICVSLVVFGLLAFIKGGIPKTTKPEDKSQLSALLMQFSKSGPRPHDRVLYIVVDEDAAYINNDRLEFPIFSDLLRAKARELKPDYTMTLATDLAHFGKIVQVYDSVRNVFGVPGEIGTRPLT